MNSSFNVRPLSRLEGDPLIRQHYLKRWPGVTVLTLGLFDGFVPIGIVVFALPPRETIKRYGTFTWELARLFIVDGTPKNTESWFMARAVKYVKCYYPNVGLLISYADPSAGHSGTIYKAGNWISDGRTDQERKSPRCDYMANGKMYSRRSHVPAGAAVERVPRVSKFRFVYWMKGHEKKRQAAA